MRRDEERPIDQWARQQMESRYAVGMSLLWLAFGGLVVGVILFVALMGGIAIICHQINQHEIEQEKKDAPERAKLVKRYKELEQATRQDFGAPGRRDAEDERRRIRDEFSIRRWDTRLLDD